MITGVPRQVFLASTPDRICDSSVSRLISDAQKPAAHTAVRHIWNMRYYNRSAYRNHLFSKKLQQSSKQISGRLAHDHGSPCPKSPSGRRQWRNSCGRRFSCRQGLNIRFSICDAFCEAPPNRPTATATASPVRERTLRRCTHFLHSLRPSMR